MSISRVKWLMLFISPFTPQHFSTTLYVLNQALVPAPTRFDVSWHHLQGALSNCQYFADTSSDTSTCQQLYVSFDMCAMCDVRCAMNSLDVRPDFTTCVSSYSGYFGWEMCTNSAVRTAYSTRVFDIVVKTGVRKWRWACSGLVLEGLFVSFYRFHSNFSAHCILGSNRTNVMATSHEDLSHSKV
jgi:hypothetical protein